MNGTVDPLLLWDGGLQALAGVRMSTAGGMARTGVGVCMSATA